MDLFLLYEMEGKAVRGVHLYFARGTLLDFQARSTVLRLRIGTVKEPSLLFPFWYNFTQVSTVHLKHQFFSHLPFAFPSDSAGLITCLWELYMNILWNSKTGTI